MFKKSLFIVMLLVLFTSCTQPTPKKEGFITPLLDYPEQVYYVDEFSLSDLTFSYTDSEGNVESNLKVFPGMLKEGFTIEAGLVDIKIAYGDANYTFTVNLKDRPTYTTGLQFNLNRQGDGYVVVSYDGKDANVIIPKEYNHLPVTEIKANAFENNLTLTNVDLPDTITKIGDRAFFNCVNLKDIILPNNITSVGSGAFFDSLNHSTIFLPKALRQVGESAFNKVNKFYIEKQDIPEGYSETFAQEDCVMYFGISLNDIKVKDDLEYLIIDNEIVITGINLVKEEVTIPQEIDGIKVTSIGDYAMTCVEALKTIDLGSVEVIGKHAFSETGLTSLTLPSTLKEIKDYAFSECKALTTINFSEGLKVIRHSAFSACENITELRFPRSLETIEGYAFQNCYYITSAYIHLETTSVGEFTFYANQKLTIYYEGATLPSTWNANFNPSNRPIKYSQEF